MNINNFGTKKMQRRKDDKNVQKITKINNNIDNIDLKSISKADEIF